MYKIILPPSQFKCSLYHLYLSQNKCPLLKIDGHFTILPLTFMLINMHLLMTRVKLFFYWIKLAIIIFFLNFVFFCSGYLNWDRGSKASGCGTAKECRQGLGGRQHQPSPFAKHQRQRSFAKAVASSQEEKTWTPPATG